MKSLMVFDLDGTLAKSKSPLEADLLDKLMGGGSSIDVTRPGVDKAYGIHKLQEVLGIPTKEMIFVGDALFPGGNDEPARKAGATCVKVRDPDLPRADRVAHLLLALRADEAGFATVANCAFSGARWRLRRRAPAAMRPALDHAGRVAAGSA